VKRLLVIVSVFLVSSAGAAQFPSDVRPGTRVRVWIPEAARQAEGPNKRQLLRGEVDAVSGETLRLRIPGSSGAIAIPRTTIRRLDVSRGVSRAASMAERAVGVAIASAITFGIMNDPDNSSGPNFRTDWEAAGVGAAVGAGFGAVIGLIWPHERWRKVIR
jgi:hypothetical protein